MNMGKRLVFTLVLAAAAWPAFAADFFWNCTTADGLKYADATKCDKGDTAVKVMKGNLLPLDQEKANNVSSTDCQRTPSYCASPDYGVPDASLRTQAITHFMRQKECEFHRRSPNRCVKPD
jgi:hypothetical protein